MYPPDRVAEGRLTNIKDNGTVRVLNTATVGPQKINIIGTATPVDAAYGAGGAFVVSFPGNPGSDCPGPNYIVQGMLKRTQGSDNKGLTFPDYAVDWAIVQTQKWNTLYILSRERQPAPASIDVSPQLGHRRHCLLIRETGLD